MVKQIQYAEELGFESVWLAEHHFTRSGIGSSAMPLATYVAGQTKKIRIGTIREHSCPKGVKKADG